MLIFFFSYCLSCINVEFLLVDSLSLSLFGPKLQKQVGSGVGLVGICLAHVEASKVCFQKKKFSKFKSCWKKKNHLFLVFTMVL